MLTARNAVNDRVEGLDVGADDYLVKALRPGRSLLARLRALLRRHNVADVDGTVLRFEDLTLNPQTREVHRGARLVELTKIEFGPTGACSCTTPVKYSPATRSWISCGANNFDSRERTRWPSTLAICDANSKKTTRRDSSKRCAEWATRFERRDVSNTRHHRHRGGRRDRGESLRALRHFW